MAKSTITRERLEALANAEYCKSNPGAWLLGLKEVNELARMALAAMDSEPVAEVCEDYAIRYISNGPAPKEGLRPGDKLYRHAQPAPVVPDEIKHRIGGLDWGWEGEFNRGWNACRAAMLQASPVCTCPSGDGSLRWPCPVHPGNSLAIGIDVASGPDRTVEVRYVAPPGYVMVPKEPTREILDEFDSIIDYGAEDSEDAWRRLLAAAQQEVKP
ncbi:TPA: hypothetical protein MD177_002942 [Klebsiella pneumoniae]|nr:hypothetical protein [Klebsiella pneumoniae]HBV5763563.1 hypothetical protein [Klebsiella pneumoniae]